MCPISQHGCPRSSCSVFHVAPAVAKQRVPTFSQECHNRKVGLESAGDQKGPLKIQFVAHLIGPFLYCCEIVLEQL